jgi:biotin carboxylase
MSVLGDKIAANILAQTAGVPSIPWSGDGLVADLTEDGTIPKETFDKGCIHTLQQALDTADRIGYPVMLKASEGGGGKGIRMSANKEELISNYDQARLASARHGFARFILYFLILLTNAYYLGMWLDVVVCRSRRRCPARRCL